jgi:hypothetical protein
MYRDVRWEMKKDYGAMLELYEGHNSQRKPQKDWPYGSQQHSKRSIFFWTSEKLHVRKQKNP